MKEVEIVSGPLRTERCNDGERALLRALDVKVSGKHYIIPKGFKTDFSSIPWFGRFIVRWSKVDYAGVVHDYLYQSEAEDRKRSDEIWRLIAISGYNPANKVQAGICWFSLRVGGGPAWNNPDKKVEIVSNI